MMNVKQLKEMVELMNNNGLSEIELESDGTKVKLKKAVENVVAPAPISYAIPPIPAVAKAVVASEDSAGSVQASKPVIVEAQDHLKDIKSPMVGTFYRASSPEAAPFVEIGQIVEVGQVVCIVEAMKLMNEIKSEVRGKVVEISVNNAEPVEFGQVLFRIDPAK